jgi:hypothetical protein
VGERRERRARKARRERRVGRGLLLFGLLVMLALLEEYLLHIYSLGVGRCHQ